MNADDARGLIALLEESGPPPHAPGTDSSSLIERFPDLSTVAVAPVSVPGPHGTVAAQHYRGTEVPRGRLVWIHGGGFVAGDLEMPESHWVALTLASQGIEVLAVDYRKALSGVRYPVPSDDVLAAWRWSNDKLGAGWHLGGASAGANLATGVVARLRDAGAPVPSSLILVYPLVHSILPPASHEIVAATASLPDHLRIDADAVDALNHNYIAGSSAGAYAFPGDGELEGFPPVYVINAERDTLRSSGELFAEQLSSAGVEVECETEMGAVHGYLNEPGDPGATRSLQGIIAWLGNHTGEH